MVGSQINIIDESGKLIGKRNYPTNDKDIRTTIFYKSPFAYPSVCIRMPILKKVDYPDFFNYTDDYYLWSRLLKFGRGANLDDFLLNYRIRENQVKKEKLKIQLKETIEVQKMIFKESKNVPLAAYFYHFLHKILLLLPSNFILWLFKNLEYKKFKK